MSPPDGVQVPYLRPAKLDAGTLREAQAILERYQYKFLAKKIAKMATALELSEPDDDA